MLTTLMAVAMVKAAEPDALLGYSIGQATGRVTLPRSPQGGYMTTAIVASEPGKLFLVPCGGKIKEIIFQVWVFPPFPGVSVTDLPSSSRLAAHPREEARRLRGTFVAALQAAGWVTTKSDDLGAMGGSTLLRNGIERSVDFACEPDDEARPEGAEACRISIHAGGVGWCTDGL